MGLKLIGIGILEKKEGELYAFEYPYKIIDTGNWSVKHNGTMVEFSHELTNGTYPYFYTKTIEFLP